MRLDRNVNPDGKGKYAVINLRKIKGNPKTPNELCAAILLNPECVEFGERGSENEFFVLKLKDQYAANALEAYARAIHDDETNDADLGEYAGQILAMSHRALLHPNRKKPD